ncbi:signal peptidase I [Pseudomonadota bacterium]
MDFDFEAIMVLAALATGVIWAIDVFAWKPVRKNAVDKLKERGVTEQKAIEEVYKEPVMVEYARSFFPVILAVLVLRSFLVEPFRIPSGSMMPTLLDGDFILVNKYEYGIRLPVLGSKVVEIGEPSRGDVAVFRYPEDPSIDYIKRIVGVPGDTIAYYGKQLYVNGELAKQQPLGAYAHSGTGVGMTGADRRLEALGDVEHEILVVRGYPSFEGERVVPEGHYFAMGDNRDNSRDSRVWGFVPDENLVGRAFMIWMNWDKVKTSVSWDRIGKSID